MFVMKAKLDYFFQTNSMIAFFYIGIWYLQ